MAAIKKSPLLKDLKKARTNLQVNQNQFWTNIGVTQSGGSRYENGRNVPPSTAILLELVYGDQKKALEQLAALRGVTVDQLMLKQGESK